MRATEADPHFRPCPRRSKQECWSQSSASPVCPLPRLLVTQVSLFFIFCHPNSEEATGQIDLTDYNGTCLAEPLFEGLEDE